MVSLSGTLKIEKTDVKEERNQALSDFISRAQKIEDKPDLEEFVINFAIDTDFDDGYNFFVILSDEITRNDISSVFKIKED